MKNRKFDFTPPACSMHATLGRQVESTRDEAGMLGPSHDKSSFCFLETSKSPLEAPAIWRLKLLACNLSGLDKPPLPRYLSPMPRVGGGPFYWPANLPVTGGNHQLTHTPAPPRNDARKIAAIIDTLKKPDGFRLVSASNRRLLIAAILATVVPRDGKVLEVEIKRLSLHLVTRLNFTKVEIDAALNRRDMILELAEFAIAAKSLSELLGKHDLEMLVGMMWDIAMCDRDLHPLEEGLIYQLADAAGLARKLVILQQARAASANNAA